MFANLSEIFCFMIEIRRRVMFRENIDESDIGIKEVHLLHQSCPNSSFFGVN